ncbi:DMT family transporter [Streptomyces sp. NPDC047097]|uniref:DMT family transporter n=1 Tax=Streptomyces sp. NPDC047097 TaxID=3155260 RepID=UPI0033D49C89
MHTLLPVVLALCTAFANALATVLQRMAALSVPSTQGLRLGLLRDLAHRPVWLGGMVAVIVSAVCQAAALATGPLTIVQPLFVLELPFALVIASLISRSALPRPAWAAVAAVVVGLGVGLAAADPTGNRTHVPLDRWVITLPVCAGVVALLISVGLRRPHGRTRAACLGLATAISYALTAALMKQSMHTLDLEGIGAFLTAWQTYGFAIAGTAALFLLGHALQSGPLVASQPAITLGDALVSLTLGVVLYEERIRTGWWLAPELIGLALIATGAVALARLPLAASLVAPPAPSAPPEDRPRRM